MSEIDIIFYPGGERSGCARCGGSTFALFGPFETTEAARDFATILLQHSPSHEARATIRYAGESTRRRFYKRQGEICEDLHSF